MSTAAGVEEARALEAKIVEEMRQLHGTNLILAIERNCVNAQEDDPYPCGVYARLRAAKSRGPYANAWQRWRAKNGLTTTEAAWAQLLAHPPSAPLVHVDHGHRLEGAATGGWCMWGDYVCQSENLWRERIETEGRSKANARLNKLRTMNSDRGGNEKGSALNSYERAEWEALERLLSDPRLQSSGSRVRAYRA